MASKWPGKPPASLESAAADVRQRQKALRGLVDDAPAEELRSLESRQREIDHEVRDAGEPERPHRVAAVAALEAEREDVARRISEVAPVVVQLRERRGVHTQGLTSARQRYADEARAFILAAYDGRLPEVEAEELGTARSAQALVADVVALADELNVPPPRDMRLRLSPLVEAARSLSGSPHGPTVSGALYQMPNGIA